MAAASRKPSTSDERTFTEAARRKQIIASAIDTIAELGFNNASLAAIAERAGTSKSVISYHFAGGKHELIGEMIEYVYQLGGEFMVPLIATATNPREALRLYITTNLEFIATHPKEVRALVETFSNYRPEQGISTAENVEMSMKNMRLDVEGLANELLAPGQRTGHFRQFDPRVMAMTIRASIDIVPPLLLNDPSFNIKAHAKELAALFDLATRATPND